MEGSTWTGPDGRLVAETESEIAAQTARPSTKRIERGGRSLPKARTSEKYGHLLLFRIKCTSSEIFVISCSKLRLGGLFVDHLIENEFSGNPNALDRESVIEEHQIGSLVRFDRTKAIIDA